MHIAIFRDLRTKWKNWVARDGVRDCRFNVPDGQEWGERIGLSRFGAVTFLLHFLIEHGCI